MSAPGMEPESHKAATEAKLQIGKDKKDKGDEFFKAGDLQNALRNYHEAIMYIKGLDKNVMGAMEGSPADGKDKKTESDIILEKIYGNVCACHIKNQKWAQAERAANEVLKKNPDNTKATFRKAKALAGQGFTEKSIALLEELVKKDPDDVAVRNELVVVKAADKAASSKGLSKFKGFLSKSDSTKKILSVEEIQSKLEETHLEDASAKPLEQSRIEEVA